MSLRVSSANVPEKVINGSSWNDRKIFHVIYMETADS